MNKDIVYIGEEIPIIKIDEELRIVKGVVYKPNVKDAHGDWMTKEDIRKAAYDFMKNVRLKNIDVRHNLQRIDAYVCESYIAKDNDPDGYPAGSWVVAVKIEDDEVWQEVLNGEYQGFSMYGKGYAINNIDPPEEVTSNG